MNKMVAAIFISPAAGSPMQEVSEVEAIAGVGLKGDRYFAGKGSFSKGEIGRRQITLINGKFFKDSIFAYQDSRRNIITLGVELMWLIGREFQIGNTCIIRGLKYCDPCERPSIISGKEVSFKEEFEDCGGLVGEIIKSGLIRTGDPIIPPPKGY